MRHIAACAIGLVVWRRATGAPSRGIVAGYAGVATAPWLGIPAWNQYLCGEPWAFVKIQSAWGRSFCLPWNNPHLRQISTQWAMGGEWEAGILLVRVGLATVFLSLVLLHAFREWRRDPSLAKRQAFVSFLSLLGFAQIVLFFSTSSLIGANRLFALALPALLFGASRLSANGQLAYLVLGVILQAAMHTLFNLGHRGFIW